MIQTNRWGKYNYCVKESENFLGGLLSHKMHMWPFLLTISNILQLTDPNMKSFESILIEIERIVSQKVNPIAGVIQTVVSILGIIGNLMAR